MENFTLDNRLKDNCHIMGDLKLSTLLLMNNSLIPWFILVPKTTETEMIDLSPSMQSTVLEEINLVSTFIRTNFNISKLNIATIGNIVNQLHVHIVGRSQDDYCWPNVVWGTTERIPYTDERIAEISTMLSRQFGNTFNPN